MFYVNVIQHIFIKGAKVLDNQEPILKHMTTSQPRNSFDGNFFLFIFSLFAL